MTRRGKYPATTPGTMAVNNAVRANAKIASCAIIVPMTAAHPSPLLAYSRSTLHPDRHDPHLRLGTIAVFVRDKERSRQFYVDQLGFRLAVDVRLPSVENSVAVTPPDGTAVLSLVAPKAGSDEYQLIGRSTQIIFLTEDVFAKFEEWSGRGVRFHHPPQVQSWGATSTTFGFTD